MLDGHVRKMQKAIDKGKLASALLTDLSKAFDCLNHELHIAKAFDCVNHELLIVKLNAYGFDLESLTYIYSYLKDRKQRTKNEGTEIL